MAALMAEVMVPAVIISKGSIIMSIGNPIAKPIQPSPEILTSFALQTMPCSIGVMITLINGINERTSAAIMSRRSAGDT